MAERVSTKTVAFGGLMIALVFLGTRFISIPGPVSPGYLNLGDSMIMLTAIILGGPIAGIAGAIGSALADLTYGSAIIFAPFTFVIKGLEGLAIGFFYSSSILKSKRLIKMATAFVIGATIMVFGYFIAEWLFLGLLDETFGIAAAVGELPGNIVQGLTSCVVAFLLSVVLTRMDLKKIVS